MADTDRHPESQYPDARVFRDRAAPPPRARFFCVARADRFPPVVSAVSLSRCRCYSVRTCSKKSATRPAEPTQTHHNTRLSRPPPNKPHKAYCHNPLCSAAFQLHLYTVNASTVLSSQLPPPPPHSTCVYTKPCCLKRSVVSHNQGAGLVRRELRDASRAKRHSGCAPVTPDSLFYRRRETAGGRQVSQGISVCGCAARASTKVRITLRRLWFGMSALLSSVAPVFGEVSLVRSHSVMAARS